MIFISSRYRKLGLWREIIRFFNRVWVLPQYFKDKNISIFKKVLLMAMLVYVFSPIDLLPDPILGFGFVDDIVLAIYAISKASHELDKYIINKDSVDRKSNEDVNTSKIIDNVEYEVKEDYDSN